MLATCVTNNPPSLTMKEDKYIQTTIDKITGYLGILSDPAFSVVVGIVRQSLLAAIQYGREEVRDLELNSPEWKLLKEELRAEGATKERERILKGLNELNISAERKDLEGIAEIYSTFWKESLLPKITRAITTPPQQ